MKSFNEQVWELCRKIPKGRVATYKEIARTLDTKAYRSVGNALNKNPYAPEVPCHRVIKSNGKLGGFAHGIKKKEELLRKEKVFFVNGKLSRKILYFSFKNSSS